MDLSYVLAENMRRRTDNVERVCGDLSDGGAEESFRSLQDAVAGAVEGSTWMVIHQQLRF
jgi:predicted AAA+ superfamily ATPase